MILHPPSSPHSSNEIPPSFLTQDTTPKSAPAKSVHLYHHQKTAFEELDQLAHTFFQKDWSFLPVKPRFHTLICGPTGTGKTKLAQLVAQKHKTTFIALSPNNWKPIGARDGETSTYQILSNLFSKQIPIIIFIDELDKLCLEPSSWATSVRNEIFDLLDEIITHTVQTSENRETIEKTLKTQVLILAAGTFQDFFDHSTNSNIGFGHTPKTSFSHNNLLSRIPRELANRFNSKIVLLPEMEEDDYHHAIISTQSLLPDWMHPLFSDHCAQTLPRAIEEKKGCRFIEETLLFCLHQHPLAPLKITPAQTPPPQDNESDLTIFPYFISKTTSYETIYIRPAPIQHIKPHLQNTKSLHAHYDETITQFVATISTPQTLANFNQRFILIEGISGTGKTTLADYLVAQYKNLRTVYYCAPTLYIESPDRVIARIQDHQTAKNPKIVLLFDNITKTQFQPLYQSVVQRLFDKTTPLPPDLSIILITDHQISDLAKATHPLSPHYIGASLKLLPLSPKQVQALHTFLGNPIENPEIPTQETLLASFYNHTHRITNQPSQSLALPDAENTQNLNPPSTRLEIDPFLESHQLLSFKEDDIFQEEIPNAVIIPQITSDEQPNTIFTYNISNQIVPFPIEQYSFPKNLEEFRLHYSEAASVFKAHILTHPPKAPAQILLINGGPGTGKTSLAYSIINELKETHIIGYFPKKPSMGFDRAMEALLKVHHSQKPIILIFDQYETQTFNEYIIARQATEIKAIITTPPLNQLLRAILFIPSHIIQDENIKHLQPLGITSHIRLDPVSPEKASLLKEYHQLTTPNSQKDSYTFQEIFSPTKDFSSHKETKSNEIHPSKQTQTTTTSPDDYLWKLPYIFNGLPPVNESFEESIPDHHTGDSSEPEIPDEFNTD